MFQDDLKTLIFFHRRVSREHPLKHTWNDNIVKTHLKSYQNKMNRPKKAKIDKKSSIGSPIIKKKISSKKRII